MAALVSLAVALGLSFSASLLIENGRPSARWYRAPASAFAFRFALHAALFAAAFALSWRPWHAAFVTSAIAALFGAGNLMKLRILGEPLVFTDFALVRLAIRHPRLYYADRLLEPCWLACFAGVALATVVWFWIEPSILPAGGPMLLVIPPLVAVAIVAALRSAPAARAALAIIGPRPDAAADTERLGLGCSMLLGWLVWRRQDRPGAAAIAVARELEAPPTVGSDAPLIVAIQCESFLDVAARGLPGPELSAFRALTAKAIAWGRCAVPAEGAYTMRSEFCFLTGLPAETLGFDVLDPFLTAEPYAAFSIARRFAEAGRRSTLIHPYDARFFERDRLAPTLGFERFVDIDAFGAAERVGPYVSDAAVADRLVTEIEAANEPGFLFAVTMENHGPWGPGRISGVDDAWEQYALHLANADRMIGRVAEALLTRPGRGILCVYGDHAPARSLHPALPDRQSTDFLLWDARSGSPAKGVRRDLPIDAVGRMLIALR